MRVPRRPRLRRHAARDDPVRRVRRPALRRRRARGRHGRASTSRCRTSRSGCSAWRTSRSAPTPGCRSSATRSPSASTSARKDSPFRLTVHVHRRRRVGRAPRLAQGPGRAGDGAGGRGLPLDRPRASRPGRCRSRSASTCGWRRTRAAHGVLPDPRRGRRARADLGLDHARAVAHLPLRHRQARSAGRPSSSRSRCCSSPPRSRSSCERRLAGSKGDPTMQRHHAARRRRPGRGLGRVLRRLRPVPA